MAVNLSALAGAGQQFFNDSGVILSGGKLYSYAAGTTTPQTTYTSASGSTAHSNPIILNSAGRVATGEIWLTAGINYKFALYTSTDVLIATWDNITGINGTGITTNASSVQYDPAGTGAVATTVQAKLRQYISAKDFGAVGDGTTDDTTALQNAINAAYGSTLYIPEGRYVHTGLTINQGIFILGDMPASFPDIDTYTTINGGTTLWNKTGSDSVTIQAAGYPTSYTDKDFQVGLRNINFAGARYTGSSLTSTAITTGSGVVVNAGDATESAIHLIIENVFCFSMPEHGWNITGQVYGCNASWMGANYCGKNGLRISAEAFTNIAGEWYVSHYRGFWNGNMGSTENDKSGVFLDPRGASMVFGLLTSSNNYGPNFKLARGGVTIQQLHCETQVGTVISSAVIFGDGTNATQACTIDSLSIDPGVNYALDVVLFNNNATRITINQLKIGDTGLTGNAVKFSTGSIYNSINWLFSASNTITVDSTSGTNFVKSLGPCFTTRVSASQTNVTGDGTVFTVPFNVDNFDIGNNFNNTTYRFTAPFTGIYDLNSSVYVTGADGVNHNDFEIKLLRNGTDAIARNFIQGLKPTGITLLLYKKQSLSKGDYIELQIAVSGGAKTVDITAGDAFTYFSGSIITPTTASFGPWQ